MVIVTVALIFLGLLVPSGRTASPCPAFGDRGLYTGEPLDSKNDAPPFTLTITEKENDLAGFYKTNKTYTVKLISNNENAKFRSILVQPRTLTDGKTPTIVDRKVGQFVEDESWELEGVQMISCSPLNNDSVGRTLLNDSIDNLILQWRSPASFVGPIQFVLTIIVEPTKYWEAWQPLSGLLLPVPTQNIDLDKSTKAPEVLPVLKTSSQAPTPPQILTTRGEPKDPCADNQCKHGGICIVNGTSFTCKCPDGFLGQFCQWECPSYLCQHGGKCTIDQSLNYVCLCTDEWTGNHCEESASGKTRHSSSVTSTGITSQLSTARRTSAESTSSSVSSPPGISPFSNKESLASKESFSTKSVSADNLENAKLSSTQKPILILPALPVLQSPATPLPSFQFLGGHSSVSASAATSAETDPFSIFSSSSSSPSTFSSSLSSFGRTSAERTSTFGSSSSSRFGPASVSTPKSTTHRTTTPLPTEQSKPHARDMLDNFVRNHGIVADTGLLAFKSPDSCAKHGCQNGAECIPAKKNYTCKCTMEFSGPLCQWGCPSYLCHNGGSCYIDENRKYKCHCAEGFMGEKCEDRNDTTQATPTVTPKTVNATEILLSIKGVFAPSKSIQNLIDESFANTNEKFDANLLQKIEDSTIDNRRRVKFIEAAQIKKTPKELLKILVGPDFCENSFCYNEGICISNEKLGKAECICTPGWTGTRCSVKNHCDKHKCENGAECINGLNGFTCKCRGEFSGKLCSVSCPSSMCKNGGTCQYDDAASRQKCVCGAGFTGEKCETQIDDCQFRPCHNGGTCMDKIDGFECRCTKGFMGSRCHLPCQDSYKMCKKWKDENKCSSDSRFYKSACPASCNVCVFDNSTALPNAPAPTSIEPLHFLLGRWVINSSDARQFPYDVENAKNGYYEELEIVPSEIVVNGQSALNYTSVVINNDNPSEKSFRVGLITMTTNDSITMGSIFTMGSDGVIISEQGELGYLRLELTPFFVDAPKDLESKMPTMVTRTFSLFGIYLKETVDRKTNGTNSYFTKFYYNKA